MNIHARIAALHRELADCFEELAGKQAGAGRKRATVVKIPKKLDAEPTELQRARAKAALRASGEIR